MGFPENISNLPRKFSVKLNSNAKLCEKAKYIINVIATEIFAYFSNLSPLMWKLLFGVYNIIKPITGIDIIGLKDWAEIQVSL